MAEPGGVGGEWSYLCCDPVLRYLPRCVSGVFSHHALIHELLAGLDKFDCLPCGSWEGRSTKGGYVVQAQIGRCNIK